MHNVLFVPSTVDAEWILDTLPGLSRAELPVAGRRIVDYAVESAQRAGATFIEVLDWHYSEDIAKDFLDLTRTSTPVFYIKGEGKSPDGLKDIEGLPTPLTGSITDGLVVVWGPVVPNMSLKDATLLPVPEDKVRNTPTGVYRREGGKWLSYNPPGLAIRDIRVWHLLNFSALRHPDMFTLPGYTAQKGVHIGRDVVMERGVEVTQPVLLCDHSWCARNVVLGGNVVIGARSYVGEGTRLVRTVVGDDTFVGDGLVFEDKIIIGSRVIDARTGVWADIEDPGVVRPLGKAVKRSGPFRRLMNFLFGWSRGRMA